VPEPALRGAWSDLDVVAQLLGIGEAFELLERLMFDLTDALAGDVERAPDFLERPGMLAAESVAQLEYAALAVAEVLEGVSQGFLVRISTARS
jgi:hypothetical protein